MKRNGFSYNLDLVSAIHSVMTEYPNLVPLKADFFTVIEESSSVADGFSQTWLNHIIGLLSMYLYLGLVMGLTPDLVRMKFGLSAMCIFIAWLNWLAGIGLTSYFNLNVEILRMELIPFLAFAFGMESMMLIVDSESRVIKELKNTDERIAYALKEIGPTILTANLCLLVVFWLGYLSTVQILINVSLTAGIIVGMNFILVMTVFIGSFSIDLQRISQNRADFICCKKMEYKKARPQFLKRHLNAHLFPLIMHRYTRIAINLINVCLIIIGILALYNSRLGSNEI
jgi:Niemann-Pick C1 protein